MQKLPDTKLIKTTLGFAPFIEYLESGDKNSEKAVIYLLGADVRPKDNHEFISKLSELYRVITIHFPSKHNYKYMGELSEEKYFSVFKTVTDHLEIKDFDVVGTSLGGSLAIKFCHSNPDLKIKHIVSIAPQIKPIKVPKWGGFKMLTKRMIRRAIEQRNLRPVYEHLRHFAHLGALLKITSFISTLDIAKDLENIKTSTLVFLCGKDDLVGEVNNFFDLKISKSVKSKLYKDSNHSLLYTQLDDILKNLTEFLAN